MTKFQSQSPTRLLWRTFISSSLLYIAFAAFGPAPASAGEFEDCIARAAEHVQSRQYDKAVEEYKKALKINPKSSKANLLLGLTYANTGDHAKSIEFTKASLRIEPSYAGHHNLGLIYANKGEYAKAIESYREALKLNPESYRAWYQLGLVYATDLKFTDAIASYEKVLELNPAFTDAYLGLGSAYYWSGNSEKALEQAERLKELKADDKAKALKSWIKNTDAKKKSATSS